MWGAATPPLTLEPGARIGAYELTGMVGTTKHESKSGDLTTCPRDGVRTRLPPPQCSGPLQLELVPIGP